jgi:hypothetical protein
MAIGDNGAPAMSGQIFISYRRDDSGYAAGRLFDRLRERFGRDHVFMDIDTIGLGDNFAEAIDAAIGVCDAVLAVIGRDWLNITDEQGKRRLDAPGDFVRQELAAALARDIPVIPVFVDGAGMPPADSLPDVLVDLRLRNGLEIRHERFDADTNRLIEGLEEILQARIGSPPTRSGRESETDEGRLSPAVAAALNAGEQVLMARRQGVSKRFWIRVDRAELVLTTQRLIFNDLEDTAYSFELPLASLRGATYRFSRPLREAAITLNDGRTYTIGIAEDVLYETVASAIQHQVGRI